MAEPQYASDDDLPRTLRRERDAREREREAREREAQAGVHAYSSEAAPADTSQARGAYAGYAPDAYGAPMFSGTVNRFEVPFQHLVWFFIKCVFAAIPALILLTVLLFAGGKALQFFAPSFRLFEIVVRTPVSLPAEVPPLPKASEPATKGSPSPAKK